MRTRGYAYGHGKHAYYCSCGRVVYGNGGKRHFEKEGHRRVTSLVWAGLRAEKEHA